VSLPTGASTTGQPGSGSTDELVKSASKLLREERGASELMHLFKSFGNILYTISSTADSCGCLLAVAIAKVFSCSRVSCQSASYFF
jgi:hypothetical protein